jgi:hypothetical protein
MARGRFTTPIARLTCIALVGALLMMGSACGVLLTYKCELDLSTAYAGGTGKFHEYRYFAECGEVQGNIEASWDATTRIAQEKMTGDYGTVSAEWVCEFDPWVRLDGQPDFTCTQNWRRGNLNVDDKTMQELLTSPPPRYPYSANNLDGGDRAYLNERLGNALKATPPSGSPAQTSGEPPALAPVRTRVQVQADEVQVGTPGVWDIDVNNASVSAADPVDVTFDFSGAISGALFIPPEFFICSGEGARITCQGSIARVGDPQRSPFTTFTVWVIGERPGPGTLTVTVNGSRRLAENNYADNVLVVPIQSKG